MSKITELPPGPDNLVELFEAAVKKYPNNLLFGTKQKPSDVYKWVTYKEVGDRVDNLRSGLSTLGINPGDGIGIIANNRVEWAVAAYASYGLRARFVPMYEAELPRIMKYIIENSSTKILFVSSKEVFEKVKDFPKEIESLEKIIIIDGDGDDSMAALEKIGAEKPVESQKPEASDIAGLIYTSGTTGNPKGVVLSHYNFATNARGIRACYPMLDDTVRTLSFLPWAHSFGQVAELHFLVHMGASTGFAEAPTTIVGDLLLVKPTMLIAVPRIFNKVYDGLLHKFEEQGGLAKTLFEMGLEAGAKKRAAGGSAGLINELKYKIADKVVFSKIREKFGNRLAWAFSSSAALSPKIAEFFTDIGIPVYEAWGMTELSPAHSVNTPDRNKPGTVGFPIPGSSVKVDKTLTGADSIDGELIAYGPNIMQGYHLQPEATAEVMRPDGGLATGDRGWVDEDGFVHITGRIKEQYKLENGKYVFPSGLEEAIKLSAYIENCMVHGANHQFNVAVIVPDFVALESWAKQNGLPTEPEKLVTEKKLEELMLSEINSRCEEFARYEIPKKIIMTADVFTTENGILTQTLKLKRREVIKLYGDQLEALYDK